MHAQPTAIVTGSSRGIGRAIAIALANAGHAVVVNYANSAAAAEEVVGIIQQHSGTAIAVRADIGSAADRLGLVDKTLAEFGRIDLLVNNAGIGSPGRKDLLEATEESWDTVFNTNLKGPFFLAQLVANKMISLRKQAQASPSTFLAGEAATGTIINVSSISAYTASINRGDYCMAKAAMGMMTQLFADRLASEGINVFEIAPGIIASDLTAPVKEKYDKLIADGLTPIRRWGQPEDIARTVVTLAQGGLPFSTGQRLNVDGGFHIRRL